MHRLVLGLKGSWQVSGLAPMNTLSKRKIVYILWFLSNSPHPWIFTLGVKAGLKDSISRQKASSISSSLRTEIKCIFMGNVLLSSNLIVYIQNTWEGSCWTYWAEPRCWTQELRQEIAFSPMAQTRCFYQTRRSTNRRLCTGWYTSDTIWGAISSFLNRKQTPPVAGQFQKDRKCPLQTWRNVHPCSDG